MIRALNVEIVTARCGSSYIHVGLKTAKNKTRTLQNDFKTFSSRKFEGWDERGQKRAF